MRVLLRSIMLLSVLLSAPAFACRQAVTICTEAREGALTLIANGAPLSVLTDPRDDPAALRAAASLQADLERVAGHGPGMTDSAILVGTIGHSEAIDWLIATGKLDVTGVKGRWEAYVMQVVDRPTAGLGHALVIAGADRRGTAFGAYDLSQAIGVSPWNWWADVPVPHRDRLYVLAGRRVEAPAVRYRGIFINDEDPALLGFAKARFGGFNAKFYERVFDLVLRLRGNLLWPAMWGKSFFEDDPANARLADAMGVIIGTSHHEPLMRAHVDWEHHGEGPWDYANNPERLRRFWREGVERTQGLDRIVTIGMRGDGDEPMAQTMATQLLERIVADQRKIIADVTHRPAEQTPQVWALYKEVQDYYDAGMRVPDDVTLLFSDDNWGNLRRLPDPGAHRAGGYGIYYHFDYVGGPRNYKWINTNPIQRVWQQMKLAREYGADRLWIVNVGDIKPMEFPTSFFMDMAWDPDGMTLARMEDYPRAWAEKQFGPAHAAEIADILNRYGQLISRRKPELLDAATYDLADEWLWVDLDWSTLRFAADAVAERIPAAQRDAYFELVLHPVLAAGNLHALYYAVARNRLYARQGRSATSMSAEQAESFFRQDGEIRRRYEVETAGGKWPQMTAQTHIGYTGWQQPPQDRMPEVRRIAIPAKADMGVSVHDRDSTRLERMDPYYGGQGIDIFNRGKAAFDVSLVADAPWIRLSDSRLRVSGQIGVTVSIDWSRAPLGRHEGHVRLRASTGQIAAITVPIDHWRAPKGSGFVPRGGVVTIEAEHFLRADPGRQGSWQVIPWLGRTRSGVGYFPATAAAVERPGGTGPKLVYRAFLPRAGAIQLDVYASPGLDFRGTGRQRYAISLDDGPPQVVDLLAGETAAAWSRAVGDNIRIGTSRLELAAAGSHEIRLWAVDPGLVFQRLRLTSEAGPASYLGGIESVRR
jgi:hypothetical protein